MKKGLIIAIVIGVVVPWLLSYLFLTLMVGIDWTEMPGGFPQILAILSFSSLSFAKSVPIVGYGYMIPLLIWIIVGLFCGLFAKSVMKGALTTLIGLLVNILIFSALISINPAFIPAELI